MIARDKKTGYQALLMAPTELLAEQHYATLLSLAEDMPVALRPRIALVVASLKPKVRKLARGDRQGQKDTTGQSFGSKRSRRPLVSPRLNLTQERRELSARIASGAVDLGVGTQALLYQEGWWALGLVVIDEQHKFGVAQRERLARNVGHPVHTLLMTATPIPRTLALVQYGSLVLSSINEMPPGRRPIETRVVVDDTEGREQVYQAIREEVAAGGRVYIVCPLVSSTSAASLDGDDSGGSTSAVVASNPANERRAVMDEFERLTNAGVFGNQRVGLLHGRMSGEEKARALRDFSRCEFWGCELYLGFCRFGMWVQEVFRPYATSWLRVLLPDNLSSPLTLTCTAARRRC